MRKNFRFRAGNGTPAQKRPPHGRSFGGAIGQAGTDSENVEGGGGVVEGAARGDERQRRGDGSDIDDGGYGLRDILRRRLKDVLYLSAGKICSVQLQREQIGERRRGTVSRGGGARIDGIIYARL